MYVNVVFTGAQNVSISAPLEWYASCLLNDPSSMSMEGRSLNIRRPAMMDRLRVLGCARSGTQVP